MTEARRMTKLLVVIVASVAIAGAARAQDAAYAARMREVNAAVPPPDQRAVDADALATLQAIGRERGTCIPSGVRMERATPATADRLAIQSIQAGQLKNVWLAYGVATGCPGATTTRFIVLQLPDGTVRARVVNVGESIAWPSLMRDASTAAAIVGWNKVKSVDPTCDGKDLTMVGSRVSARGGDLGADYYGVRYQGGWEETWAFKVCGQTAAVPVSFKADGMGGADYHVDQARVMLFGR